MSWVGNDFDFPASKSESEIERSIRDYFNREESVKHHLPVVFLGGLPPLPSRDAAEGYHKQECKCYFRSHNVAIPYMMHFIPRDKYTDYTATLSACRAKIGAFRSGRILKMRPDIKVTCPYCKKQVNSHKAPGGICPHCHRDILKVFYPANIEDILAKTEKDYEKLNAYLNNVRPTDMNTEYDELYWYIEATAYIG